MNDKYQEKYRISSARAPWWDYSSNATYFITICTRVRIPYFGQIVAGNMQLSEIGQIAHGEWFKTPIVRPDMQIVLYEFIVMPNHIHGIIGIGKNEYNTPPGNVDCRDAMHRVSTETVSRPMNKFEPQRKNLASIIRGYKSAVTKFSKIHLIDFAWQPRFHDHIIRDMYEYERIATYILNNPSNWPKDDFHV